MPRRKKLSVELDISELFDTPQQRLLGINAFYGLKRSTGWQLIQKALQTSIDNLSDQILEGSDKGSSAEEKLYFRDRLINQRKAYKGILDLPDYFIEKLKDEGTSEENLDFLDPYDQVEVDKQD